MYHMKYFTIKNSFFLVPSTKCNEEFEKINKFLSILEKSGVGKLINLIHQLNKINLVGRKGVNDTIRMYKKWNIKMYKTVHKNNHKVHSF